MDNQNTVDIEGIDKVLLLKDLWENVKPAGFFMNIPGSAPSFYTEKAKEAVGHYID
jgi:hypothetical protein